MMTVFDEVRSVGGAIARCAHVVERHDPCAPDSEGHGRASRRSRAAVRPLCSGASEVTRTVASLA
jgi:hypothetical protein